MHGTKECGDIQPVCVWWRTRANVIADFDNHFQPVKNVIYERMIFYQIVQKPSQSIHQFISEAESQIIHCNYAAMADEMVRDRIVVGAKDGKLQECLVDIEDVSRRPSTH